MKTKVQKGLADSYEKLPDGKIVRYRVVEEVIDNAERLENEKASLLKRIGEIDELLGAITEK